MKKLILILLSLIYWSGGFAQSTAVTARDYNNGSDKIGSVQLPGFWGNDGRTYVFQGNPANFAYPVNVVSSSAGTGPLQFLRNLTQTSVSLDTTTPANNRPLPISILAGDSLGPVSVGSGNTTGTTLRFRLVDDQTLAITCASCATETTLSAVNGKLPTLVSGRIPVDGSGVTQPVSAASLPLPTGASTSALQTTGNNSLSSIDGKVPALGQALAAGSVPVVLTAAQITTLTPQTNALTDTQLRASAVPVSVAGVATAANQTTGNTSLSSIDGKLPAALSLGRFVVDGSQVTQPISAAALPLPSGAASSALQTTGNNSLANIDGKLNSGFGVATSAIRTATIPGNASGIADFGSGASTAQTLRVSPATDAPNSRLGKAVVTTFRQDLSSNSINTTYDQIAASTSAIISRCSVFWPGDEPLWLSTGGSGSEVVLVYVPPGGQDDIPVSIPAGTRLAWRSEASTYATGFAIITCYGV